MKTTKAKSRFSGLRIAYLFVILAVLASCGGYGWRVYTLFRDAQLNMPQPQVEKLVKDLRLFHSRTNRFPNTFNEINDLIWHSQPRPDYGTNGRQARTKNYYYFYTRVNDGQCAIWATPLGPRRHYASSFFLVLSPDWLRGWKGAALTDQEIEMLPAIPALEKLAELGMSEMPGLDLAEKR